MAIGIGSLIEVSMIGVFPQGKWYNVFQYTYAELITAATAAQIAEAWWNHTKATYRALYTAATGSIFESVFVRELNNPAGEYATYAVPVGERAGTRTGAGLDTFCPPFLATGVQLTVGSRVTRPGQKRLPVLYELDVEGDILQSAWMALVESWASVVDAPMVLGAPAATSVLGPIVTRKDATGEVTASQAVTGHLTNIYCTTQNSRKRGRGF